MAIDGHSNGDKVKEILFLVSSVLHLFSLFVKNRIWLRLTKEISPLLKM